MTDTIDCVVIGAGIVGLAVARALAARGREVVVLESAEGIGTGTSSRNSEVIHAGLYYATGSLKARLCVAGNRMMVDYCRARGIPHNVVGKLIVATDESEIQTLRTLLDKGRANNVTLHWLDGAQAREMEPPASSTATSSCCRSRPTPRPMARCSRSTRQSWGERRPAMACC